MALIISVKIIIHNEYKCLQRSSSSYKKHYVNIKKSGGVDTHKTGGQVEGGEWSRSGGAAQDNRGHLPRSVGKACRNGAGMVAEFTPKFP